MKFQNDFKMISTCQIKMPQNATKYHKMPRCQDAKMSRCQDAKSKYQIVIKIPNCYQNVKSEFQIELCMYFFSLICLRLFIFIQKSFHYYRIRCKKLSELPEVQGCDRTYCSTPFEGPSGRQSSVHTGYSTSMRWTHTQRNGLTGVHRRMHAIRMCKIMFRTKNCEFQTQRM